MSARDALTETERAMLGYALDLAQDQIHSRGDEFTADDQAALDTLRRMADAGPDNTTPAAPGPGTCDCMETAPHPKLPCGHCAMDVCEDCKTCAACPHTCNEGGAT